MSFLAPLYLLLGLGVAVPLLVHLLRRRAGREVRFPATRYLLRAERDHSRTLKLRNLLLMALRVALLAAVVLAAARPSAWLGGGGHAPTAVAVVMDNSLSTTAVARGRPAFDEIRMVARQVLTSAHAADRVWLVTADGRVRGGTPAVLARELDAIEPLSGAGDPPAALARAGALVASSGFTARAVVLLTDGQRTTWEHAMPQPLRASTVIWTPALPPPPNNAVTMAAAQPVRWTPRGTVVARFFSSDSTTYRMTLGGRTFARGTTAPGQEVTVNAAPPERGWQTGTVELEPDELPLDNTRYFAVWVGPATGVTALPGAGPFVSSALDVLRGAGRVAAGRDAEIASADEAASLPALLIAPTDASHIGIANRTLQRLDIPWRFGPLLHDSTTAVALDTATGGPATRVTVAARYQLGMVSGTVSDTLWTAGGKPWIVAGKGYVLVASPLTPEATSLPVSAGFLSWLGDVVTQRLSGEPGQVLFATPGSTLASPRWADAIELANGDRAALDAAGNLTVPSRAGTYFLDRGVRRVGAVVVNPPSEESLLQRFTTRELASRISRDHATIAADAASTAHDAYAAGGRRPLAPLLLGAALALLLIEAWMTGGWRRRAGATA